MSDEGDGSCNQERKENTDEHARKGKPPTQSRTNKGSTPSSAPTTSLTFGTFQVTSALSLLWGDRVKKGDLLGESPPPIAMMEQTRWEDTVTPLQLRSQPRRTLPVDVRADHAGQEARGTPSLSTSHYTE